jgi:16S rRNA (guanine966-N2)-methyltransferase
MMRITGGEFCGRRLKVPNGIRPTQDRVKEALFSSLGERICGGCFLDLFAGSGAVGLDALSRGAESACWVESDSRTAKVLQSNVSLVCDAAGIGAERTKVVVSDALAFARTRPPFVPFDVIFADPPYDSDGSWDWLRKALQALGTSPMLAADGVLVVEQGVDDKLCDADDWTLIRDKAYGKTRLLFFRRG